MEEEVTEVSRRSFLKTAAVVTGATVATALVGCSSGGGEAAKSSAATPQAAEAGSDLMNVEKLLGQKWSFEIPPEPVADSDIKKTYTADIIIVGCGISGLCTAVSAAEKGADVLVFSAGTKPVGRGGSIHAFDSDYQRSLGINYTPETSHKKIKAEMSANTYEADFQKWDKWINNSRDFINWMEKVMEKKGLKISLECGYSDPEGIFDVPPSAHGFWKDGVKNPASEGAPLVAQAYADTLTEDYGIEIHYSTVAQYLIRGDNNTGRVSGVVAKDSNGDYVKYVANKAVVLATGDFSNNADLLAKYNPSAYDVFKEVVDFDHPDYDKGFTPTGLMPGDGQKMGLWVGAAWQRVWPNAPMYSGGCGGPYDGPYDNFTGINLNINGKRFMNEATPFAFSVRALLNQPQRFELSVWDVDYAKTRDGWHHNDIIHTAATDAAGVGHLITPEEYIAQWDEAAASGMTLKADTIEALIDQAAAKFNINKENALESIKRYNEYAKAGVDEEYHVDSSLLFPIAKGPFYAECGSIMPLTIMGGLRTNINMQVCEEDDTPVEGLYNIGVMVGDFYATVYTFCFAGQNLGSTCGALAWLLGKDLAAL